MKKFTKFKLSGASKKRTTCESYVLCGVDNINKVNTKWISVEGGTAECAVLLAQLELCKQAIEEHVLQSDNGITKEILQGFVELSMGMLKGQEQETPADA